MTVQAQFLSLPNAPLNEADVLILPLPYERTVSFESGTAAAPAAILEASDQLELYEEDAGWSPFKHMTLAVCDPFHDDPGLAEGAWHDGLTAHVAALPQDNLLVALGGEHSLTPSLAAARLPEPGTVLFLDAHADLRDSYQGSRYSHACPVTRLLEQGHKVVMAGIRSICESEVAKVESEQNISLFMDWDLRGKGQWEAFLQKVSSLEGPLYLSIDMDVFSPTVVPGVGTPQPGGFFWYQMIEVLEALFSRGRVDLRGVDIVEMVPEPSRVSEMAAAKLLLKVISFWGYANGFNLRPEQGAQAGLDFE